MPKTHSWQAGKKASGGNHMINTKVNLDLAVNTFGFYNLNNSFAVEKSGESSYTQTALYDLVKSQF